MPDSDTYEASCHCGGVKVHLAQKPDYMNDCNCSLCRNAGAVWGYFSLSDVQVTGETRHYERRDIELPAVSVHFCPACGGTTHWTMRKGFIARHGFADRMGVNMHLFGPAATEGVELRFPDGKAWTGQGDHTYRRDSVIVGKNSGL